MRASFAQTSKMVSCKDISIRIKTKFTATIFTFIWGFIFIYPFPSFSDESNGDVEFTTFENEHQEPDNESEEDT